jgi:phytoene dehydrogenase-like protein
MEGRMFDSFIKRRDFLKSVLAGIPILALDWSSFQKGTEKATQDSDYDAIIIGSGLGGLSCAMAFARQGFKALVLEQHSIPGGYSTSFKRPGGFEFDVSLHSTTVDEREGIRNLIPGFPEIKDIEFVPHKNLYRVIFPDYDIRVPQHNVAGYIDLLIKNFPEEEEGIKAIFEDMRGYTGDIQKYISAEGEVDMASFPKEFPYLFKNFQRTWAQMLEERITEPKLQAVISALWGYFGLPPSRLSSLYYALPTLGYLEGGGYYPIGKSQKISNAMASYIEENGGRILLRTRVDKILHDGQTAYGVETSRGVQYRTKAVISNANAYDTFNRLIGAPEYLKDYMARMEKMSVSLSSFQVFLGLKEDLVGKLGIEDSEIFVETGYDTDAGYEAYLKADMDHVGYGITLYDNLYKGYSPEGKNTVNIINRQGFEHWEKYEADYWSGRKDAYRKEKNRMADVLIDKVEEKLMPGLRKAIEVKEIGTPLTNVRYTSNYRGAIYGWDQTVDNSGPTRIPQATPIKNLYLSGAWTSPGHGYSAVLSSGLQCFAQIMRDWEKQ